MKVISRKLVRKVLELMKRLTKFWKEFNKNLKMGCYEDDSNRSKLSKLLRFATTKSEGKEISLDKYLDRMQETQESIYYMSGDSMEVMQMAPALQIFKKKDVEVLMLSYHLDEPCRGIFKLLDVQGFVFENTGTHSHLCYVVVC